jgi:hypothetical protein
VIDDETHRPGIDRRTVIKRAAAAGAIAWTAPVILDSTRAVAPGCRAASKSRPEELVARNGLLDARTVQASA